MRLGSSEQKVSESQVSAMRSSVNVQSGFRLPFAAHLFTEVVFLTDSFLREVLSYDEFAGWADLSELLDRWPAEGHENHHRKCPGTARQKLKNQRRACQALAALDLIGMVDHTGMQKNRLQLKKCKYASESYD
eukprot:7113148-Pyramimonas_sp.AAC.1